MNTALQTFQFDGIPVSVVDQNGEGWMIGEDIGKALDYNDPRDAINKIYERNRDDLEEYSVTVKLTATDGKKYDMRVYNEEGVMMVGFFSKQPKAVAFRKWAVGILKAYRHNELAQQNQAYKELQLKMIHLQTAHIGLLEEKVSRLEIRVPRKHQADEIAAALRCRQEGFSYRDIGELLNRSKESVSHMVRRAEGRS